MPLADGHILIGGKRQGQPEPLRQRQLHMIVVDRVAGPLSHQIARMGGEKPKILASKSGSALAIAPGRWL